MLGAYVHSNHCRSVALDYFVCGGEPSCTTWGAVAPSPFRGGWEAATTSVSSSAKLEWQGCFLQTLELTRRKPRPVGGESEDIMCSQTVLNPPLRGSTRSSSFLRRASAIPSKLQRS